MLTPSGTKAKWATGSGKLVAVYISESVTALAPDAFDGAAETVILVGTPGSAAETFAVEHDLSFPAG